MSLRLKNNRSGIHSLSFVDYPRTMLLLATLVLSLLCGAIYLLPIAFQMEWVNIDTMFNHPLPIRRNRPASPQNRIQG